MSGVQVDHSPAVATHSLNISSWTDADLSALTSSEKKRYYTRKSAVQDYFTTEEPLSQIASRYHLPVKMLEKLTKRCQMRHEDGAPWGYRALVPGITAVDHPRAPEPEPAAAPSKDAIYADAQEAIHEEKVDNTEIREVAAADEDGEACEDGETRMDEEADAINRVPTEPASDMDNDAVGTRFIASALATNGNTPNNDANDDS